MLDYLDLGADIIKIERPKTGDQTKGWHSSTYSDSEASTYYLSTNRNKRSVTLDPSSERGHEVFCDLASDADIVLENFRVGKMES